jgi:hypothetical protein
LVDRCDYARNPETNLLDNGIGDTKVWDGNRSIMTSLVSETFRREASDQRQPQ